MDVQVPTLDEMREMSDAELLRLRTRFAYDSAQIDVQLASIDEPDDDWKRRANIARLIRQRGLSAIKNILTERGSEHKDDRKLLFGAYMKRLNDVVDAARMLLDDDVEDDDLAWQRLEEAVDAYDTMQVDVEIVRGTLL